MKTVTITFNNEETKDRIIWFLKHLQNEGVEIISEEDFEDLKLLAATRGEESIPFSEYLYPEPAWLFENLDNFESFLMERPISDIQKVV